MDTGTTQYRRRLRQVLTLVALVAGLSWVTSCSSQPKISAADLEGKLDAAGAVVSLVEKDLSAAQVAAKNGDDALKLLAVVAEYLAPNARLTIVWNSNNLAESSVEGLGATLPGLTKVPTADTWVNWHETGKMRRLVTAPFTSDHVNPSLDGGYNHSDGKPVRLDLSAMVKRVRAVEWDGTASVEIMADNTRTCAIRMMILSTATGRLQRISPIDPCAKSEVDTYAQAWNSTASG